MELFFWGTIVSKVWTFAHRELDLLQNRNVGLNVGLPTVVIYFLYWQRSHFIATQKSSSPYSNYAKQWMKQKYNKNGRALIFNQWMTRLQRWQSLTCPDSFPLVCFILFTVCVCFSFFFFFVIIFLMSLCSAWESAAKKSPCSYEVLTSVLSQLPPKLSSLPNAN